MMACAHEAWLVSWILPQHLTSAMALESVCRGQIFWPAGPTPGKSWGGWFILQNLGICLELYDQNTIWVGLLQRKGEDIPVLSSFDRDQWWTHSLPSRSSHLLRDTLHCSGWKHITPNRTFSTRLLTDLVEKVQSVSNGPGHIAHTLYCDAGIFKHDVKPNHLLLHDSTPLWRAVAMTCLCRSFVPTFVFLPSTFCPPKWAERRRSFCQEYFNKSHIKFGLAMLVRASDVLTETMSVCEGHVPVVRVETKHVNIELPTNTWNGTASSVLLCLRGPVITCYWVCVKATDPKIHRFRSND